MLFNNAKQGTVVGEFRVDCVISEKHSQSMEVTSNPVEQGLAVTDHIAPKPKVLAIEGLYTDTPVTLFGDLGDRLLNNSSSLSRVTEALNFFNQLTETPTLLEIITPIKTYSNMTLQDITFPRSKETGQGLQFSVTFIEVRVVESQEVSIEGALSAKGATKAKLGKVQTRETSDSVNKKGASLLRRFTNAIGITPGGG